MKFVNAKASGRQAAKGDGLSETTVRRNLKKLKEQEEAKARGGPGGEAGDVTTSTWGEETRIISYAIIKLTVANWLI